MNKDAKAITAAHRVVASDREFTHTLPQLLTSWYRGAAMLDDYDVNPEANAKVLANMSDGEYEELAQWMIRCRDLLGHQDQQLWRCINVPPELVQREEDGSIPQIVHMTAGKNPLCSWADNKKSCDQFFKLLKEKERVEPNSVAFIVTHDMPADAQCLNHRQALKLCNYALANAPSEHWQELSKLLAMPVIQSQREYICYMPKALNMEVVKVLKDGVR